MTKQPFFSIVLPTRSRASMLKTAIETALAQTFTDFELIVSDNFSTDNTTEVVKSFNDERIKYFRSDRDLSMGESWNFALSHATGEYVAFLADDDAYAHIYLEKMHEIIIAENAELVSCKIATFCSQPNNIGGRKFAANTLLLKPFTGELSVFPRAEAVRRFFDRAVLTATPDELPTMNFPQLVNAVYKRELIEKVTARIPNIFAAAVSADVYTGALFINAAEKFCYLDAPLYLHNAWEGSATVDEKAFFDKYPSEKAMPLTPLDGLNTQNYICNTVLRARADWGTDYCPVEIDWTRYRADQSILSGQANFAGKLKNFVRRLPFASLILSKLPFRPVESFQHIGNCASRINRAFLNTYAA